MNKNMLKFSAILSISFFLHLIPVAYFLMFYKNPTTLQAYNISFVYNTTKPATSPATKQANTIIPYKETTQPTENNPQTITTNKTTNTTNISNATLSAEDMELLYSLLGNKRPSYPVLSIINKEEGKVIIRTAVENRKPTNTIVFSSSTYNRLDSEALSTIQSWRFPYDVKELYIPIIFVLKK